MSRLPSLHAHAHTQHLHLVSEAWWANPVTSVSRNWVSYLLQSGSDPCITLSSCRQPSYGEAQLLAGLISRLQGHIVQDATVSSSRVLCTDDGVSRICTGA